MERKMNNGVKVMKASALYTREYGAEAYEAYMRREAEIDVFMRDKNLRCLNAGGAHRLAGREACRAAKHMAA